MGLLDKMKNLVGIEDAYYDEDYADEYDRRNEEESSPVEESSYEPTDFTAESSTPSYTEPTARSSRSNVVSMSSSSSSSHVRISIQEPLEYDDGPGIIDNITERRTVIMNLEMLEVDKKRQIFDFVSGGVYALEGNIKKVTKDIYVITPKGVEVDGSLKEAVGDKSMYQL